MSVPTADELARLLELATEVALEAGELLAARLHQERTDVSAKSSPTDMVSEVDRESEALIVSRILAARADDGIIGEEGAARPGESGFTWVIDPLDGTTNYLYRIPAFAVSIGIEWQGKPVVGVVHDPSRHETFTAMRDSGARLNATPIHASNRKRLQESLIGTGFGYDSAKRRVQADALKWVLPAVRDIRRGGAAALDLCSVACGRLDGYFEQGLQHWDYSAGSLMVDAAGGTFRRRDDGLVIAATPAIFENLVTLVTIQRGPQGILR